jgi:hypothetical protein
MHGRMNRRSTAPRAAIALALVALMAGAAGAQSTPGTRWQAWLGCWSAAPTDLLGPTTQPVVCITPSADADVAELTTIAGGKVISTQRVDASGHQQPVDAKGCTGVQRAQWSGDQRRVYLKSEATCEGVRRSSSGILSMTAGGEWLDVQSIAAGEGENVHVARYHAAALPSGAPANVASALEGRDAAAQAARVAVGATIGTTAVIEASRAATPAVVEAWLLERGQEFALDARTLVALADAGVPARVTDALVAVSNPKTFAVAHPDAGTRMLGDSEVVTGQRIHIYMEPASPWDWGYAPGYGYSRYGYGSYGYGSYYGAGYYGLPGYYGQPGYYGGAPIIVVNGASGSSASHGRIVKGQGYQPGDAGASTGRSAQPRSSSSPSPSESGSSSSTSRAPAPAAPAPAPRTAQPRP